MTKNLDEKQLNEMEELTESLTATVKGEIEGLHASLKDELKKGAEITNQKVIDLELKLAEAEKKRAELEETVRLQAARPTVGGADAKRDIFKGAFLQNADAVREILRNGQALGQDQSRSI